MTSNNEQNRDEDERRPSFLRSPSLSFREKPQPGRGSALTRRASNRKKSSKRSLQQHRQRHSFSHHDRSRNTKATPDTSPKLLNCFETPPPRTKLGLKNSENWTSFHNRYAESNKRPRRQQKPKKSKEERDEAKKRRPKKRGCLWSALSCFRRKDTTYHGDEENYEWSDERVWSLGKNYAGKLVETERRQLHLME